MKRLACPACSSRVYFERVECPVCASQLAFVPATSVMASRDDPFVNACQNRAVIACNWSTGPDQPFCLACRLNRTVPNLSHEGNAERWQRIERGEAAARRGSAAARASDRLAGGGSRQHGLAFDLVSDALIVRAGPHGPRERPHHARHRGSRRRRARGAADGLPRTLPHAARPFPARDRALLFRAAGREHDRPAGLPRGVRRRARGLSASAATPLPERRPARLARTLHLRLCEFASVGRLGGNIRAFPAYRRDARYRDRDLARRPRRLHRRGRLSRRPISTG